VRGNLILLFNVDVDDIINERYLHKQNLKAYKWNGFASKSFCIVTTGIEMKSVPIGLEIKSFLAK